MAAHHIVPVKDQYGLLTDAHDILRKHDIGINDAVNGVFLPTYKNTDSAISGILHSGVHPKDYLSAINSRIRDADVFGGKQAVLDELDNIRNILGNANRNSDWRTIL